MANSQDETLTREVEGVLQKAVEFAFYNVNAEGYWHGELTSNVTITSEYIFLRQAFDLPLDHDRAAYCRYLLSEQNADGSWSLAPDLPGDVSTTTEAYLALKILGVSTKTMEMQRARQCVRELGGVAKVRVFTRMFLATFGLFPWDAVPQLPAELVLLPAISPINIYKLASWARSTVVPMLIICHHQPIYALPNATSAQNDFLDELWLNPTQKDVPYAASLLSQLMHGRTSDVLFTACDTLLYYLDGLRSVPFLRKHARRECIKWILDRQEDSGDWAGIFPPMHAGIYALMLEGYDSTSSPVRRGIDALERFAWQDEQGKRIQPCVSPIWDTALMSIGLLDAGVFKDHCHLKEALAWIKSHQRLGPEGDWRVYRPDLAPGGWTFEIFNSWYPDVDDTAAVILALIKQDVHAVNSPAVLRAYNWVLGMQNSDGGWAAFDVMNDALFLNDIPFSDMDAMCDPSTADVTGRVLEAFGLSLRILDTTSNEAGKLAALLRQASQNAIAYVLATQEPNGAWFGRWGSNYVYGTSNVVCGLAYFKSTDKRVFYAIRRAQQWLKLGQNPDGGWGESLMTYRSPEIAPKAPSTPSQTAWALMALLAQPSPGDSDAIRRGVQHLVSSQTAFVDERSASWPERIYTGVGFPNHFYLGYTLYRHYFPLMALGRYLSCRKWR